MSIGIVSDSELQQELERLQPQSGSIRTPSTASVENITPRGRSDGDVNVPESLRKIIGEEAVINGRESALNLASEFGISPSSVSAYAKGATSTTSYDEPKKSIIDHINKSRRRHIKKASHVLSKALEAITQDKLDYTDASDLSGIAKDMSVIIKNLEPPQQSPSDGGSKAPQFIIYAPQFKQESSFDVIDVKE